MGCITPNTISCTLSYPNTLHVHSPSSHTYPKHYLYYYHTPPTTPTTTYHHTLTPVPPTTHTDTPHTHTTPQHSTYTSSRVRKDQVRLTPKKKKKKKKKKS